MLLSKKEMSPNKGPKIIKYCVISSTLALIAMNIGLHFRLEPQYKVNKIKLLCAEQKSNQSTDNKISDNYCDSI